MSDKLKVSKVESKGYGIIYKLPMQDKDLDVVAKAFYAYICSYAGAGDKAFPTIERICSDLNVSRQRLLRHRKALEEKGYITVTKVTNPNGTFKHNEYKINKELEPALQNPPMDEPALQNPPMDNVTTNNNIFNNNIINNKINKDSLSEDKSSDVAAVMKFYKTLEKVPRVVSFSDKRKKHINARLREYGLEVVKQTLIKATESNFLVSNIGKQNFYDLDWIFNQNNFVKILEGKYDNKKTNNINNKEIEINFEEVF